MQQNVETVSAFPDASSGRLNSGAQRPHIEIKILTDVARRAIAAGNRSIDAVLQALEEFAPSGFYKDPYTGAPMRLTRPLDRKAATTFQYTVLTERGETKQAMAKAAKKAARAAKKAKARAQPSAAADPVSVNVVNTAELTKSDRLLLFGLVHTSEKLTQPQKFDLIAKLMFCP